MNIIPKPNKVIINKGTICNCDIKANIIDSKMKEQEYSIVADNQGVKITAGSEKGLFYAQKTLSQIDCNKLTFGFEIYDKPFYNYRALLIDVARHFLSIEKLKQTIDMMAFYKLNVLHLHLTDDQGWRVEIEKYPLLTQNGSVRAGTQINTDGTVDNIEYGKGCFYTKNELKSLVAYAKEKFIDILPEFDIPGHMLSAISNYPQIACKNENTSVRTKFGVENKIGCAGSEDYYNFAYDIIDELCEIFPYEYFHIGGDEAPKEEWKICPKCQEVIKSCNLKDENALQVYMTTKIVKYLTYKGKKSIVWDEHLGLDYPKGVTLQLWRSELDRAQSFKRIQENEKIIISYGPYFYFDYFYSVTSLKKTYSYCSEKIKLSANDEPNILGLECCLWSEWINNEEKFDLNLYPRMQAFAEVCWTNKENRNFRNFEKRLEYHQNLMQKMGITSACKKVYNPNLISKYKLFKYEKTSPHSGYGELILNKKLKK